MGRRSSTGGVTPAGDRIQVRFTYQGKDMRPTLNLKPTAVNLKHAHRLREQILFDIKAGQFNLAEFFPDYRNAELSESTHRSFLQWAELWGQLSARSLENSTIRIYKRHLKAYWVAKFGDLLPKQITHEKVLEHLAYLATSRIHPVSGKLTKPLGRKTQNNILIPLRGVFELICKSDPYVKDPTDGIDNLKVQKAQPDPFTAEEVELILAEIKDEALSDYFEFSCFAGLRISEQIALLWEDVDLRQGTVKVRRARVLAEDKERTKTGYEREVELNARALAVIKRQRARTQAKGIYVFLNPSTGLRWNDEQEQRREWVQVLRAAKVRYRPPKECRDTSVTLSLMAGAEPLWVAKQHGHSVTVMMKSYARFIPRADKGRNLEAVNAALKLADSAVNPQYAEFQK
jgi:integrase